MCGTAFVQLQKEASGPPDVIEHIPQASERAEEKGQQDKRTMQGDCNAMFAGRPLCRGNPAGTRGRKRNGRDAAKV